MKKIIFGDVTPCNWEECVAFAFLTAVTLEDYLLRFNTVQSGIIPLSF
jgi:hypothetical protein